MIVNIIYSVRVVVFGEAFLYVRRTDFVCRPRYETDGGDEES